MNIINVEVLKFYIYDNYDFRVVLLMYYSILLKFEFSIDTLFNINI